MKSKLKFLVPILLLAVGGVYKFVLAKPEATAKPKIDGEIYVLPKDFLINLDGGRFAKLGVALIFHHGFSAAASGGGHGAPAAEPPEGYGVLPQEAVVRHIVTDVLTGEESTRLQSKKGRAKLQHEVLERIEHETDVKAHEVLFTDIAVQ